MTARSSISNSNDRVPRLAWVKVWAVAILVALAFLFGWEWFWRSKGFRPSVNNDVGLWMSARDRVTGKRGEVVLTGTSRMQIGLDLNAFEQATGVRPVQLAMIDNEGITVLMDLCQDESFKGTVICEMVEDNLRAVDGLSLTTANDARRYIEEYRKQTFSSTLENRLRRLFQQSFVFRLPELSPSALYRSFRTHGMPEVPYTTVRADRSIIADYARLNIEQVRARLNERIDSQDPLDQRLTVDEFLHDVDMINESIARLKGRGGDVVFVHFPHSGKVWDYLNRRYPKEQYWDRFASRINARTIHFKDYPALAGFDCPDYAHLDYRDAEPFTKALVEILWPDLTAKNLCR